MPSEVPAQTVQAISAVNLSKCYQIYETPKDRLRQVVYPRLQRALGLPLKQYHREFWALRDIDFEIHPQETVGIIGRNGAGKSTLLQILCGTLAPTFGTVNVNGRVAALLELGSGFNPDFTGRENVYLNGSILGLTREDLSGRIDDILAFADIGEFIDQPVRTYSSGMYVRLAFAIIAHVDADILIVDEALAVGDALFTQKCMRFLRRFQQKGTLLFVSHDSAAVINLCQRAIWLDNGLLRMFGGAKQVSQSYLKYALQVDYGHTVVLEAQGPADEPQPEEAVSSRVDEDSGLPGQGQPGPHRVSRTDGSIEVQFFDGIDTSTGWKTGKAEIHSVRVLDVRGNSLSLFGGGEDVVLEIEAVAREALVSPILGFFVKDRLGQSLFGEHTFNYSPPMLEVPGGSVMTARFRFQLPLLANGDYAITVSVAEGTPFEHVQHHWLHDAMVFKVVSSTLRYGLVGIPFKHVQFETRAGLESG